MNGIILVKRLKVALRKNTFTVSGQNIIGIYIIPLVLIQHADRKQNTVSNNWRLKLHPAVMLQNWSITAGCNSNNEEDFNS